MWPVCDSGLFLFFFFFSFSFSFSFFFFFFFSFSFFFFFSFLPPDQNLDVDDEVLSESRQLAVCQQLLARLWLPSTTIIISLFNGQLITLQQQPFICCLHYILTVCPDRCVGLNPGQRNLAATARWLLIFLKAWENKLPVREGCHGVSELTQQSDCSRHCF